MVGKAISPVLTPLLPTIKPVELKGASMRICVVSANLGNIDTPKEHIAQTSRNRLDRPALTNEAIAKMDEVYPGWK